MNRIEAGLEFDADLADVVTAFKSLPTNVRPLHFSHDETPAAKTDSIDNDRAFAAFLAKSQSGFYLLSPTATYSVRIAKNRPIVCDCFLDVSPEEARTFLEHMAASGPRFGFACHPGEREFRNRISLRIGGNLIETWVGRDTANYIPGFYWLTLTSLQLLRSHHLAPETIERFAVEHKVINADQHLFRFYDHPDEWQTDGLIGELMNSGPNVFNIKSVNELLAAATTYGQVVNITSAWR